MVIHTKSSQRGSWDPHGIVCFYVGPAMHHYCCFKCYIPSTRSERVTDTVTFLPHKDIIVPKTTPDEFIKQALQNILTIVKLPQKKLPYLQAGSDTHEALKAVDDIFKHKLPDNQTAVLQVWLVDNKIKWLK